MQLLLVLSSVWTLFVSLLPFGVLLGLLIFIHELGHFLVARFYGVRVEVFSLGFGKKILKWKRGDTLYCISMIPLGGYVKMFGHTFTETDIPPHEKPFSFLHKSLKARMAIVVAGPLMNLLLALIITMGLIMVGKPQIRPVVGTVSPASPAHTAGFRLGDRILSVGVPPKKTGDDRQRIHPKSWTHFKDLIFQYPLQVLQIQVERASGEKSLLLVTPDKQEALSELGVQQRGGVIEGLSPWGLQARVGVSRSHSPAYKAGIKTFDRILSIGGQKIRHWYDMEQALHQALLAPEGFLKLRFQREQKIHATKIKKSALKRESFSHRQKTQDVAEAMGFEKLGLFIGELKSRGPAEQAGLQKGDKILAINKKPVQEWASVVNKINSFDPSKNSLLIDIKRQGQVMNVSIVPEKKRVLQGMQEETRYMLGIVSGVVFSRMTMGEKYTQRELNPVKALWQATKQTLYWCMATGNYLKRLITGEMSRKTLGGVIAIGQVAYKSYSYGLIYFFEIMALLSIQLFLLNILPVPVLDGGHLLFCIIEYFKGRPLSVKNMMLAHYVGFFLLISLFIFVTFNDLDRWINVW